MNVPSPSPFLPFPLSFSLSLLLSLSLLPVHHCSNDMVDFLNRKHIELTTLSNEWEEKLNDETEAKDKELEKLTSQRERDAGECSIVVAVLLSTSQSNYFFICHQYLTCNVCFFVFFSLFNLLFHMASCFLSSSFSLFCFFVFLWQKYYQTYKRDGINWKQKRQQKKQKNED